jgi:hypothetical protein
VFGFSFKHSSKKSKRRDKQCVLEDIVGDVFKFHKREVGKRGQTAVELANI